MFHFRYGGRELWSRRGRTLVTAVGLAAGVGLVVGIGGISQGLDQAQRQVLSPLKGVGTDILVTRVVAPQKAGSPAAASGDSANAIDGTFFGDANSSLDNGDAAALVNENESVVTDLSKLGPPGTKFTHDFFLPATYLSFPDDAVAQVAKVKGVVSAVGGLTMLAEHQSGTVPKISTSITTGGNTIKDVVKPAPMSTAEAKNYTKCLVANHAISPAPAKGKPAPPPNPAAVEKCLPARFKTFRSQVQVPLKTIQKIVQTPRTDTTATSYTVGGVDPSSPQAGLVTAAQVTAGRFIATGAPNEVLINAAYATKQQLAVGGKVTVNGQDYPIVGIVSPTLAGDTADVYFPLATLQQLAGKQSRINAVLVKAKDTAAVTAAARDIQQLLPGAQVVTSKDLDKSVTGSLTDAKRLVRTIGSALAGVVLVAAFLIAVLLTISAVAKRVREIGTLRALGWSKRMVVRQVVAETFCIGLVGAAIGVAVGFGASAAIGALAPSLTATNPVVPGLSASSVSSFFGTATNQVQTVTVHLHAPVQASALLAGIAFAVVGGLLAGAIGGWRAARMAPAEALRTVG